MTFSQRRILGGSVLLACVAIGAAWLLRLDYSKKISTDVLDLIPAGERDPELAVVRELASEAEARTVLIELTLGGGAPAPAPAAQRFAGELRATGAFVQAIALADPGWRDALGRELFEQRFALLFPTWLRDRRTAAGPAAPEDLARAAALRLKGFLATPEAVAFQDLVPADPLLLLPDAVNRLKRGLGLLQAAEGAAPASGLVWAQLAASPLSEAGQAPAFAAIEHALVAARADAPTLRASFTGVNRFAAASRARIEHEVAWLNSLSLAAVLLVAGVFIRAVHRALHLVPVIALATLGAWVATTLVFERVHVIVFVLGALLTGVAIDYGFYLFMQPPATAGEDYPAKVRRLARPLLASCFTTVTGFALLLFSELPMIRQLGVFVGAGLLCALGAALVYFATVRNTFLPARTFDGVSGLSPQTRRRVRGVLIGCWVVALLGLARLTWRDDIRDLEVPARELQTEDARIRSAFGQRTDRAVYLSHGATLEAARTAVEQLERWLGTGGAEFANLAAVVPTRMEFEQARQFAQEHPDFPAKLGAALEHEGFSEEEFGAFREGFARFARSSSADLTASVQRLQRQLVGPLSLLLHVTPGKVWFVTLARGAVAGLPPPDAHTVTASQLQSLNRLFAAYRLSAVRLSLAGLALVGLGVLATYGWRDGLRIFAIPCGACLGIFGLFGWVGHPLNLFHLLGAFLGVCLTHNYSIFSATSAFRCEPTPVSVRLSALTTGASFGVLALSGIPVVRALGLTVMTMVLAALLVIELEHLRPLAKEK